MPTNITTTPRIVQAIYELKAALLEEYGVDHAFIVNGRGHCIGASHIGNGLPPAAYIVNSTGSKRQLFRCNSRVIQGVSRVHFEITDDGLTWRDVDSQEWCLRQQWVSFGRYEDAIEYIHEGK